MIPVEVKELSPRVVFRSTSSQAFWKEVDLASEARKIVHIKENALKQRVANRYNSTIILRSFQEGD